MDQQQQPRKRRRRRQPPPPVLTIGDTSSSSSDEDEDGVQVVFQDFGGSGSRKEEAPLVTLSSDTEPEAGEDSQDMATLLCPSLAETTATVKLEKQLQQAQLEEEEDTAAAVVVLQGSRPDWLAPSSCSSSSSSSSCSDTELDEEDEEETDQPSGGGCSSSELDGQQQQQEAEEAKLEQEAMAALDSSRAQLEARHRQLLQDLLHLASTTAAKEMEEEEKAPPPASLDDYKHSVWCRQCLCGPLEQSAAVADPVALAKGGPFFCGARCSAAWDRVKGRHFSLPVSHLEQQQLRLAEAGLT
ncbi:hypothetical protein HDE_09072 [Halotydeus destructor]|nr:hypothetical protein HDE_09072 [Halotydeus destructor]